MCNSLNNISTPPSPCGYVSGANACSDRTCGDVIANPTQSVCFAYLSTCYFNGTSCATKPATGPCSGYTVTSAIGCNNLSSSDITLTPCGYVASATTCSVKTCGDVIANPS